MRSFTISVMTICGMLCVLNGYSFAVSLLPSQEDGDVYTVKICQDHEVINIIKSSIDRFLGKETIIAKGMQADDIHLEAVLIAQHAVYCSITVEAEGFSEAVPYIIGSRRGSYVIMFGGEKGSKLFPEPLKISPVGEVQ